MRLLFVSNGPKTLNILNIIIGILKFLEKNFDNFPMTFGYYIG